MKKVLLLLVLLLQATSAFGAISDDMSAYVRKDVFEVYMQNINANTERILEELRAQRQELTGFRQELVSQRQELIKLSERIDGLDARLSERIDGLDARLSERINGLDARLSSRMDSLDARMGDLRNGMYLWLVILGIIISLPMVQKILQTREQSRSGVTLDEVRRLIEENNQKLMQNLQS